MENRKPDKEIEKAFESLDYVLEHREMVKVAAEKIVDYIKYNLVDIPAVRDLNKEILKRAACHDDDKVENADVLSIYNKKYWDECPDEDKKTYYKLHKTGNRHHVDYHIEHGTDMDLVDFIEFICDNYSSTYLRRKPFDEEILEEQKRAGFTNYYRNVALNTFAMINPDFLKQRVMKYSYIGNDTLLHLIRDNLLYKRPMKVIRKRV